MLNEVIEWPKCVNEIATTYNLEDSEYTNTFARDSVEMPNLQLSPLKVNDSIQSKMTSKNLKASIG